ncbi:mechanosensitive ion channel isoform A [Chlorella sorokiniana]|uniref:Mechanosensitive ion channel isoform A n=1 Tax=Chlorella sorokiniana TaxID=3076 RepID=A0A2P6TNG8_CHLSO|nr:mechanosensitive ion channel isoform A [Chlorella sorokiniana]|eukprot:PRW50874.1 mechanosensitive ion channel isoform A [Chlorella sorokiniana]
MWQHGLLLRALDTEAGRRIRERGDAHFNIRATLLASAAKPCQVMLPLFCATRAATVVLALAEVAATKLNGQLSAVLAGSLSGRWAAAANWLVLAAGGAAGGSSGGSSAAALLGDPFNDGLVPLLRLLSTGLSILIALAATGVTLVGFGFHIGPLMASIGGVGVVLGLATQDLLQNLTAAVSLYVTRPFVAGDHIKLINQEGVEVEGTVINIEPTRTILRDTSNRCIVHLANSEVAQFIIMNRTQCQTLSRLQELQAQTGGAGYAIRTLPELAMAMRSAELPSDSDSDTEEASGAPCNGTAAVAAAMVQTGPGPAFAG